MFDLVRADLHRALRANQAREMTFAALCRELFNPGTQAILCYRLGSWIDRIPVPGVRHLLKVFHFVLQYFFAWRVGIFIPTKARIGPGIVIHTWGGGVFIANTTIGRNLTIVGGGVQMDYDLPSIGDDVWIAPGTKVIGRVSFGDRARTAPNTVIKTDIPADCVAFGNPARVIGPIPRGFAPSSTPDENAGDSPKQAAN